MAKNNHVTVKRDKILCPNGTVLDYIYQETLGGVIIVPILDDGRLVLVSEYRHLMERRGFEFPKGGMMPKETAAEAAPRELLEETGYSSSNFVKLSTYFPAPGNLRNEAHVYLADELTGPVPLKLDDSEDIEVVLRRPDELEEMIRRGEIWDGDTLAAWALARERVLAKFYASQS